MIELCEYCGTEDRYGHTAVCVMNEVIELRAENERLRAALGQLLDAHWPLAETQDHEDANCRRAREALNIHKQSETT